MEIFTDAELAVFEPGASSPFAVFDSELVGVDLTETAQDAIDSGTVEIETTGRPFGPDRVTSGDRLEFRVQLAGESSLSTRIVAIARDISESLTAGDGIRRASIEITDFVFSTLSFRISDATFDSEDVGSVVDTLVAADAPEVGRSQIETVGQDVTLSVNGRKTLDVISQDLSPAGDAIIAQDGTDLVFRQIQDVTPEFVLSPVDLHTPVEIQRVDDELVNQARVDGGTDSALDDEQPIQSATVRVTESSRRVFQVASRKSSLDSVEIFTVKDNTAGQGVVVRLQAARNGSAVDPADPESDVARRELAPEFISDNGFTEFILPDHQLAPAENPFVIVEGAGPTGHEIGTDGSGNESFRAFFPFPLLARASAGDSVDEFRRRDLRRRDDQLSNEQAVQDAAQSALRRRSEPKRRINAAAATPRTHALRPGEAVRLSEFPVSDVSGTFIVTERSTSFDGVRLTTELTLADTSTL
jgi:hypothetical protein